MKTTIDLLQFIYSSLRKCGHCKELIKCIFHSTTNNERPLLGCVMEDIAAEMILRGLY